MATDTKAKGYKGHRAGTKAEKAHKLVDENPKAERKDLVGKIKKLGVSDVTAGHWFSVFRNWGKDKAPKAVASKKPAAAKPASKKAVAAKPAAKPVVAAAKKPAAKAKPKSAPVIKPAAPAAETAAAATAQA